MCNFHGYDNARRRRNERRRARQAAYEYNKAHNRALKAALNRSKPSQQQSPTNPNRPILALNRKVIIRVETAISIRPPKLYGAFHTGCLPTAALYTSRRFHRKPEAH
ncbi:MAG TPA: hypothetical protein ACHBY4_09565, partial [Arsenophonus apicola]